MSRPLVVTDCDEVLLHMVRHFRDWVGEAHGIEFELNANPFATMVARDGEPLPDVVILTNLGDRYHAPRTSQLREHGITVPVFTNQGPKGPALQRIVEQYAPSRAVFIDDLAHHHASAAELLPDVSRIHLCGEPAVARHIPCAREAGHADARLDTWAEALPWLLETLHGRPR